MFNTIFLEAFAVQGIEHFCTICRFKKFIYSIYNEFKLG